MCYYTNVVDLVIYSVKYGRLSFVCSTILICLHILALGAKVNSISKQCCVLYNLCCKLCESTEMQYKILNHNTQCVILCILPFMNQSSIDLFLK